MATPKPKEFRALRDFTIGDESYSAGDPVPNGLSLVRLIDLGGFVEPTSAPKESPNAD